MFFKLYFTHYQTLFGERIRIFDGNEMNSKLDTLLMSC